VLLLEPGSKDSTSGSTCRWANEAVSGQTSTDPEVAVFRTGLSSSTECFPSSAQAIGEHASGGAAPTMM